jgi:hypothetical protein
LARLSFSLVARGANSATPDFALRNLRSPPSGVLNLRRGFEDGAEEGFDAAIAKSAARNSKRRELIESAEELPLEIDETPLRPRQRAETARASKTKRARASK